MKVYLVEKHGYDESYDCEYTTIVKVFTNEVKAENFVKDIPSKDGNYNIYGMEVE